jgi:hypothetical protein
MLLLIIHLLLIWSQVLRRLKRVHAKHAFFTCSVLWLSPSSNLGVLLGILEVLLLDQISLLLLLALKKLHVLEFFRGELLSLKVLKVML